MDIEFHPYLRPSADLIAAFDGVPASVAANLCARPMALHHAITRICGTGIAIGPAVTALTAPGDNLAVHVALSAVQAGDMLIVAANANEECAVVGDRVAGMAANSKAAGIVADGLARDLAGLREIGLSVHARGLSPRSPLRTGPAEIGRAVQVGGVTIASGDLIIADDDGVAVIPQGLIQEALARLAEARDEEAKVMAAIKAGARQPAWLAPLLREVRPTLPKKP